MSEPNLIPNADWQTQQRGTMADEYEIYLSCADDGNGIDITTGKPLKTFDEWCGA
ncbi:MAG TPA: hypothetical protein VLA24_10710 [Pseudomonadales bacterium]|nr:hypothetical protein [Pseudomonadales bacterium]